MAVGVFDGAIIGALLAALGVSSPWLLGGLTGLVIAGVLWVQLPLAEWLMDGWENLAGRLARGSRLWLTWMTFAVIRAAGRQDSRIAMEAPPGNPSGWQVRDAPDGLPFSSQSDLDEGIADGTAWVTSFLSWSRASKNSWMWALVPYLLILGSIQLSSQRSLGGQTYTLY
jgi:hypothetical protein